MNSRNLHPRSKLRFSLRWLLLVVGLVAVLLTAYRVYRSYSIRRAMLANVTAQLEDDILSYAWLHTIARYHLPSGHPDEHCRLISQTIAALIEQDAIIIGIPASGGGGSLRPWLGTKSEIRIRVEEEIRRIGVPENGLEYFCFWIGLPSEAVTASVESQMSDSDVLHQNRDAISPDE